MTDSIAVRGRVIPVKTKRNNEMRRMRYDKKLTLQEIANYFGVTRERVRQVVGNSAEIRDQVIQEKHEMVRSSTDLSNPEIQAVTGYCSVYISVLRSGTRHAVVKDSTVGFGQEVERYVADQLTQQGIECELMPVSHEYDILVNGCVRVDVKGTNSIHKTSPKLKSPQYSFHTKLDKDCDFYVFVIWGTKDCFVVPADKAKKFTTFCWPTLRPTLHKYSKYLNAWDLLK